LEAEKSELIEAKRKLDLKNQELANEMLRITKQSEDLKREL